VPDFSYIGGGGDFTWVDVISAAVTFSIAVGIGTLWPHLARFIQKLKLIGS
jgi:hypothetical protein